MTPSGLSGDFALIGMAESDVGIVPEKSPRELCVQVTLDAVRDAGLTLKDVDGLITCNAFAEPILYHAEAVAEYLGWQPRHCVSVSTGGGTTFMALNMAAAAIAAGMANTVVVAMADSLRSFMTREQAMVVQSSSGHPHYEQPYGPTVPAYYALIARAHMHQYGTTEAHFAEAAVSCRAWASQHPKAQMRDPISVNDVLNSRAIADPLKVLDCSLVSDGGAAVVITRKDRALDRPHNPVYMLGYGEGHAYEHISQASDLTTSAAVQSGAAAYAQAGLAPLDIDLLQLYDCFTPALLIQIEDLGFCEKGAGGDWLASGISKPGGSKPLNTHGGMLSYCHPGNPGAMFGLTEAITQLRGNAGERQLEHVSTALCHAQGGIMSSHASLILGREC
ncbi:MAG: thiolase family protein [Luminiphilus sp.]|jgi:acetyl-CoA acetyltransferase|nr:thiolase family protein [Luminiphilus sp.]